MTLVYAEYLGKTLLVSQSASAQGTDSAGHHLYCPMWCPAPPQPYSHPASLPHCLHCRSEHPPNTSFSALEPSTLRLCLWINRSMHIRKIRGGFYLQRIVPTIKSVFFMCNSKFGALKFDVKTSWCRIHLDCSYCLRRAADVRRWIFILQMCLCT